MAHIAPHGDKWRAQVRKAGVRKTRVFKTKAEARLWASRLEIEIEEVGPGTGHTFSDAVTRYLAEVTPDKRGSQWESRRLGLLLEAPEFQRKLSEIDQTHVASWRDRRLQDVKASTVLREVNILKHLFRVAREEWRWMTNNPFTGVRLPKDEPPRNVVWGWREIRRVLRAGERAGPKTQEVVAAFHIALRTGMRLSEALAAPAGFDPVRRVVVLPKSKTEKRPVVVPVGRAAARLLGRPPLTVEPNEASTLFRRLTRALLIDGLTFHDARATALTHMARKLDVLTLAKVSRHKDLSLLSNTYYRETPEQIAARM